MTMQKALKFGLLVFGLLVLGATGASATERAPTELAPIYVEGQINKPTMLIGFTRKAVAIAALNIQQQFTAKIVQGALKRPF